MFNADVSQICDLIIIIGSAYFMIIKIIDSWAKPTSKFKKKKSDKQKKELKAIMEELIPSYLEEEELKIRNEHLEERHKELLEIKEEILNEVEDTLEEIKIMNNQQTVQLTHLDSMMDNLHQGQRDILRQKIMTIYNAHKQDKILSYDDKDNIDALYSDYKAINGNSYIDRVYNRMTRWVVKEDDYVEG